MGTPNLPRPSDASALRELADPMLRLPDVLVAIGVGRSTLYALVKKGQFPAPVHLTTRCRGWKKSHVDGWIASRVCK